MGQRLQLENSEEFIIAVTPVAQGIVVPAIVLVAVTGIVIYAGTQWSTVHRHEAGFLLVLGVLPALIVLTRTWRWRSHKVILTSQRLVAHGGVLARYSTQVNLADIVATHADQNFSDRLRRRGLVRLETSGGDIILPPVRRATALRRIIDRTRREYAASVAPSWNEWLNEPDVPEIDN